MFFENLANGCVWEYQVVGVTYADVPEIEQGAAQIHIEEYLPVAEPCQR